MTNNHLGGTYLKTGQLKPNRDGSNRHIDCAIEGRNGGPRVVPARETDKGKFGPALEIPVSIEGRQVVLSIPAEKGDGKVLETVFGPVGESWVGKRVDVFESDVFDIIRVVPIG